MKTCSKCLASKEESLFYFQYGKPKAWCKECDRAASKSYLKSSKGKASRRKCDLKNKDKRIEMTRKYRSTCAGKSKRAAEIKRLGKANHAVMRALRDGVIFRKKICCACFRENISTHFHHYNGYEDANLLDVVELCPSCHKEAHAEPDHEYHPRTGKEWRNTEAAY